MDFELLIVATEIGHVDIVRHQVFRVRSRGNEINTQRYFNFLCMKVAYNRRVNTEAKPMKKGKTRGRDLSDR